ncbi:glycosyltransferase family 2 protein [Butyrivibrio sp. XPD2002]|jgi:glycosyltransferase involved in cell wall biosynthesis|uniref:glycosyltransferase family 2 protein n=1 Tax=Butyrivibrio sp. XPD2002 TaxID=1280665 RepID=UPI000407F0A1|nr:glycosyltransferase family 2 protein [Butyrivibrio sp. XPD2002]
MRDISHFYFKGIPVSEQPLITVAITCYNVEKYMSRCIESVMAQTYANLDILIIDDGSRDRTGAICDYYMTQDTRIRVVHQSNQGPGTARNYAMEEAMGEYLAFLDGDDYVENYIYEYMMSAILESGAKLAICNYFENAEDMPVELHPLNENMRANSIRMVDSKELITACVEESEDLKVKSMVWNKLYHKSLLEGKSFPNILFYEDRRFTLEILHDAGEAVFVDTPLYHYIIDRKDSIGTQEGFFCIFSEWIPACNSVKAFLRQIGMEDLADTQDYLMYTRLLDFYAEAKLDKTGDKSKYLEDITAYIEKCRDSVDRIYGSRIADPKEKKRMQKFLDHRWMYDHFHLK